MESQPLPSPDTSSDGSPPVRKTVAPDVPGHAVVRRLGGGGDGDVWLLREHRTGRLVAGKVVRGAGANGAHAGASAARRELRALRGAAHPHVLPCHEIVPAGADGATAVLVSEYASGGSLGRLLAVRGRLGVGETVTAVGPIAQALAALHEQGITHSDVSPGNILFTAQGKPLLADLGAARLVGDSPATPVGTPGFEDPDGRPDEQPGALRPAADVYGLGAVAWFCLTGKAPGRTAERPPLTILREDVPPELATAIDSALAESPRERPTAGEFARAVFRSARPEPVDLAPAVDDEVVAELVTRVRPKEQGTPRIRGRGAGSGRKPPPRRFGSFGRGLEGLGFGRGIDGPWRSSGRRRAPASARRLAPRPTAALHCSAGSSGVRRPLATWGGAALVALTACAVVWALGAGAAPWRSPGASPGAMSPTPAAWASLPDSLRLRAESTDPVQAVQALAQIRARAITASDPELLERVSAPGSEASAADAELMGRLLREGRRLDGFSSEVLSAELLPRAAEAGGGTAVVRARVLSSGYATLTRAGQEISGPGEGTDQTLRIMLERTDGAWRVARILAV